MTEQNFEHMRRAMVASQLRTTGVDDPRVLAAMGAVSRECFVPEAKKPVAYAETVIDLGHGRGLNPPMALGLLLSRALPRPGDRTLVIGTGSGYSAAVLAEMTGFVVATEENPALLAHAREALQGTGVSLVEAKLNEGYADGGPYDLIVIDGAVEEVPPAIVEQLAEDGRLVTGLLDSGVTRLAVGRRGGEGFGLASFADAATPVLPGFEREKGFVF